MSNHSLPQAKGYIGRTLRKAVDPDPSEEQKQALWTHFKSQCAYCGCGLEPSSRKGHIDHLDAVGRRNHISNRVLSCDICNGDEKRERNWEQFLEEKCGADAELRRARSQLIIDWQTKCGSPPVMDEAVAAQCKLSIKHCCATLEDHYKRLKSMSKISNLETLKL